MESDVSDWSYTMDDGTEVQVTSVDSDVMVMSADDGVSAVSDISSSSVWTISTVYVPPLWGLEPLTSLWTSTKLSNLGTLSANKGEDSYLDLGVYKTNLAPFSGYRINFVSGTFMSFERKFQTNLQLKQVLGTFKACINVLWDPAAKGNFYAYAYSGSVTITVADTAGKTSTYTFTRTVDDTGAIDMSWQFPDSLAGTDAYITKIAVTLNWGPINNLDVTSSPVNAVGARARLVLNDNITIVDSASPDSGSQGLIEQQQTTNNLLTNIWTSISNLGSSIAEAILDGLAGLFIPSQEDLEEINTRWQEMLESKLGFVWQAGTELTALGEAVVDEMEGGEAHAFVFPGISFPYDGEELVILSETQVSLDNDFMDVLQPVLASVVIAVCVIAFINTAEDMLTAIVSGASYFEYLHRGKDG